jgi:hypothetical protein
MAGGPGDAIARRDRRPPSLVFLLLPRLVVSRSPGVVRHSGARGAIDGGMMRKAWWGVTLLVLLVPATASAQERFEITPFATYRFGGEVNADSNDFFRRDVEIDDGGGYGISFGIPLSYGLQLELQADRQESEFTVDDGLFEPDADIADVDVTYYHAGLLWHWGGGQVNPFFSISGGLSEIDIDLPRVDSEHRPSLGLGGGAKVFFTDNVGMRFEGRAYFTHLDDDDDRRHRDDFFDDDDDDEVMTQGEARVGLIFAF